MANWFTIHGPHPYPIEYDLAWDVYLQDKHKNIANQIMVNDRVFFYELKGSGTLEINQEIYKTPTGKMGLVHVGNVTGKPYQRSLNVGQSETYGNGKAYWSVGVPTDAGTSSGLVSREKVVSILGYKENYYFKGFAGGAGIKLIDESVASELMAQFNGH